MIHEILEIEEISWERRRNQKKTKDIRFVIRQIGYYVHTIMSYEIKQYARNIGLIIKAMPCNICIFVSLYLICIFVSLYLTLFKRIRI